MKIAFIMLAAGNSRRFGSNKLLYEIDGKPMYQHILEKLMTVANTPESITVVTQYEEIEQKARTLGTKVYINPHPDEGFLFFEDWPESKQGCRGLPFYCIGSALAYHCNNPPAH